MAFARMFLPRLAVAAICLGMPPAIVVARPQQPRPATFEIRVVDDSTGAGLPGVSVFVRCLGDWSQSMTGLSAVTGETGIATVPVDPNAATECLLLDTHLEGYSQRLLARRYDVVEGETVHIERRLTRIEPMRGRVRDQNGTPIAGVPVLLLVRTNAAGLPQWTSSMTAITGSDGAFQFPSTPHGPIRLETPTVRLTRNPSISTTDPAPLDLRGERLPTFRVSGHLTRTGTREVMRFASIAIFLDSADSTPARPIRIGETRAGADGAFTLAAVPAGDYRIRVDTSAASGGYAPSDVLAARVPITVASDVHNVIVPLQAGAELIGSVQFEGDAPAPSGFAGVGFNFTTADGRSPGPAGMARGTIATHFWTRALAPDRYVLSLALPPPGRWRLKHAMLDGKDITEEPFDLVAGRTYNVVVTFTDRLTEISGHVRDAGGREAPEATIAIFSTNPSSWPNTSMRRVKIVDATQHGRFSVTNLPTGDYFIAAVPSATLPEAVLFSPGSLGSLDLAWLQQLAGQATRITLDDNSPVRIDLVIGEQMSR